MVRHRDILDKPEAVAAALVAHVGVDPHPAVLDQLTAPVFNSSFRDGQAARELAGETRRAIAGAESFRRVVVEQAGDLMEALGFADLGTSRELSAQR